MPLTTQQTVEAGRVFADRAFARLNNTANLNTDDIHAAIGAQVAFIEANVTAINNAFPEPFKGTATLPFKRLIVALAAMKLAGFDLE